jgi:hypothetical protein
LPSGRDAALGLTASAEPLGSDYLLTLTAERFAHAVAIEAAGFVPDDNYVHLEPAQPRRIVLRSEVQGAPLRASVSALNGTAPVSLSVVPAEVSRAS